MAKTKGLSVKTKTDWVSFTPTGSWTANTTYTGRWRRDGDNFIAQIWIVLTGAPTATNLNIDLPTINGSLLVMDSAKKPGSAGTSTTTNISGFGKTYNAAANVTNLEGIFINLGVVGICYESTATGQAARISNTAPFTYANGMTIDFEFSCPIVGWSIDDV